MLASKKIILIPAIIAIAMFVYLSLHFTINIPLEDDYDQILRCFNAYVMASSIKAKFFILVTQHNEHRILLPRLISLAYYKIFGMVNFKNLIFISQFFLLSIIPLYTYLLNTLNPTSKHFNLAMATILVLFPNTCESFVWLSAAMEQNLQMLLSLIVIALTIKQSDSITIKSMLILSIPIFLNAFTGGGWIILAIALIMYATFRKNVKLLIYLIIINLIIALLYFKILPYKWAPHKFTTIKQLILFILGFSGSTFFQNKLSFYLGGFIILLLSINLKKILANKLMLLWFTFFFANAFIIGIGRLWIGSVGLDPRYGLYSLINLGFIIQFFLAKNPKLDKIAPIIVLVLILCSIYAFYCQLAFPDNVLKRKYNGLNSIDPVVSIAVNLYNASAELGIYKNTILDNNIKNMYPIAPTAKIANDVNTHAHLDTFCVENNHFAHIMGWSYIPSYTLAKTSKLLLLQSPRGKYWYHLASTYRTDVTHQLHLSRSTLIGFDSGIYVNNVKSGKYNLYIYETDGIHGGMALLKKSVPIN